jgi:predicted MFS family arabinose efflux permease
VFYVNLPLGVAALIGLHSRLPEGETERPAHGLDALGAVLLAGATCALLLACIWGGSRYAWDSTTIVGLFAAAAALAAGLVVRERRAADPIVPLDLLRTRVVAVASAAFFFVTATLFAITVFVPLFLQVTTGATPTQAGLLLVPMMLGITLSTNLAGRAVARTGRLKRFPIAGLALMAAALVWLAIVVADPSRVTTSIGIAAFGLGFGMTGQMLTVAVQNGVDRRRLGVAMGTTTFLRGLGGAIGAAALGAVFAARVGTGPVGRADVIDAVQTVFLIAAPLAAIALLIVLALPETTTD